MLVLIPTLLPKQNPESKKDPTTSVNAPSAGDVSCVLWVGVMHSTSREPGDPCSSWHSLKMEQEGSGCPAAAWQADSPAEDNPASRAECWLL